MAFFFYKVSPYCVHFHFHFFASTLCMCVIHLTSIWRILLMTDGLNAVWSNDRASPTDNNPNNLELASPQSITAPGLDYITKLLHSDFHTTFPGVGFEPHRFKSKHNALPFYTVICCIIARETQDFFDQLQNSFNFPWPSNSPTFPRPQSN